MSPGEQGQGRTPTISLIVPSRGRVDQLRLLCDSLLQTARRPQSMEVILVVDEDDASSRAFEYRDLALQHVIVPPGQTMGALNMAGYRASCGGWLMLLNDDVRARTPGWDERFQAIFAHFPDGIALLHPNDTIFQDALCTFPVVSRTFCELAGGICPPEYIRYRIDDHIEDVFNLLARVGLCRTVYMPDVVFAHLNTNGGEGGNKGYVPDSAILSLDAPRFEALVAQRKVVALRLLEHMTGQNSAALEIARQRLAAITGADSLRAPGRQLVQEGDEAPAFKQLQAPAHGERGRLMRMFDRARGFARKERYTRLLARLSGRAAGRRR